MGQPYGLDFGAVMTMGTALGADVALLADVLPTAEQEILAALNGDEPATEE